MLRGPHARNTVKRRLASWSEAAPVEGDRGTGRCAEPAFGPGLSVRTSPRPRERKSEPTVIWVSSIG